MPFSTPHYSVYGRLAVEIHRDRAALGKAAARSVAAYLQGTIARNGKARVIFACAPSQNELYEALLDSTICGVSVDWSKVTAFHMDDYVGLTAAHEQSFRHYLQEHFLKRVKIGSFHPLPAEDPDRDKVCAEYSALLSEEPIDLICLGVGENGHIAFNDPPVADFDDPHLVKVVELDLECRQQQVNDGCFPTLADVPRQAFTLTTPVFRQAKKLSIHVPGERKAAAIKATLEGPVSTHCPASILRQHPDAILYIDSAAAGLLSS